jgi:hypothetical protein
MSFKRFPHDKIGLGYNESNKVTITLQNLAIAEKKGQLRKFK